MAMTTLPLSPTFGARVEGVDISQPLSDQDLAEIVAALHKSYVLVFPRQDLTPEAHVAFSARFGELHKDDETPGKSAYFTIFGNVDPMGDAFTPPSNALEVHEWHSDHSHRPIQALASMLYGRVVPDQGGETWFSNMHTALDELPDDLRRRIEGRHAVHTAAALVDFRVEVDPLAKPLTDAERAAIPEVVHPLVKIHPVTKRPALFFGNQIVDRILGMSKSESRQLLQDLTAHVAQDRFVYRHKWDRGDLVFWDNRSVAHTGTSYDRSRYGRLMQRTTILDTIAAVA